MQKVNHEITKNLMNLLIGWETLRLSNVKREWSVVKIWGCVGKVLQLIYDNYDDQGERERESERKTCGWWEGRNDNLTSHRLIVCLLKFVHLLYPWQCQGQLTRGVFRIPDQSSSSSSSSLTHLGDWWWREISLFLITLLSFHQPILRKNIIE